MIIIDTHIWVWWVHGEFHRDPADQIIVATARIYNCSLLTSDKKIIDYPDVKKIP